MHAVFVVLRKIQRSITWSHWFIQLCQMFGCDLFFSIEIEDIDICDIYWLTPPAKRSHHQQVFGLPMNDIRWISSPESDNLASFPSQTIQKSIYLLNESIWSGYKPLGQIVTDDPAQYIFSAATLNLYSVVRRVLTFRLVFAIIITRSSWHTSSHIMTRGLM